MNAMSNSFSGTPAPAVGALPGAGRVEFGQASASAMSMQWSAIHDATNIVAELAGLSVEPMRSEVRNFPAVMRDAGGWRRDQAEKSIADLLAVIQPGIAALLAVNARGINPAAAALALWQEFSVARAALLALTPPPEMMRPRRFT